MGKIEEELKNKAKNKAKSIGRSILMSVLPWILIILIVVVIAGGIFSVFNSVKDRIVGFLSNASTTITKMWKHLTDDYWIDIGQEIEFEDIDEGTRSEWRTKKINYSRKIYKKTI